MKREEVIELVYQHCPPEDAARIAHTIEAWHVRRVKAEQRGAAEERERCIAELEAMRESISARDVGTSAAVDALTVALDRLRALVVVGAAPPTKDTPAAGGGL